MYKSAPNATCLLRVYPDTHVYVSYKIGHAGDSIIAWHDDSPLWREITESDVGRGDVVVGEVLLRSVDFENGSGKSWSERTRRKSSLSSGSVSYEITIPSGSRLGKRLKCTLTLISGKAELFYGDDVNVMDRSFKESFHGRHSDQFCMNVLYFSCFFACAESVTNLIEILNAANVDLDKAMRWVWTPQNAIVGPNGHNFLHYTAMCFWEPKLARVISKLMQLVLRSTTSDHPRNNLAVCSASASSGEHANTSNHGSTSRRTEDVHRTIDVFRFKNIHGDATDHLDWFTAMESSCSTVCTAAERVCNGADLNTDKARSQNFAYVSAYAANV
ncbi:hypothetical protein CYMTET_33377 [Cymbomonas tetramitiformis]|uniref:Uncharacterized protein n=1 Tax=Cymbomonas tetramitiformis TaxID=36881 RepID=A0AAE0FDA6_9CHLO|nr:hypothetical protein CYMTET_33377 [Cymbomonas tetramitiformis]